MADVQMRSAQGAGAAEKLTQLEPVMKQADNVCVARHVSLDDLLTLADPGIHGQIRSMALRPGMTHVVCLENLDFWSSRFGHRQFLVVGDRPEGAEIPTWKLSDVLGKPFFRLGEVPSRFQYPVAYASVKPVKDELPGQGEIGEIDAKD